MRIAFILHSFPRLSETFILNQITGLIDRGHDVDIYATSRTFDHTIHPDVDRYHLLDKAHYCAGSDHNAILRVAKRSAILTARGCRRPLVMLRALRLLPLGGVGASLALVSMAASLRRHGRYDILHCHFGPNGLLGAHLKDVGATQGKLVTTFYGYDCSTFVRNHGPHIYNRLFSRSDLILAISKRMKQQLLEIGCSADKLDIHHLGVDCSKFAYMPHGCGEPKRIRVLTIGRFMEKKGIEYAIRAVAKVATRQRNFRFAVIGDGELRPQLMNLIKQLNIQDVVTLLGSRPQNEVIQTLADSHILLAPSITSRDGDQEGTPTVILEALATGKPVLSSFHAGIPELIQDGVSGLLSPERDVDALADKLSYLIDRRDLWLQMGRAGRAYVEREHDINKLNDRLVETYKRLLNN